ncbi:MAG: response regulator [Candidatus Binatia bacterium]|nr:response regulator [Candidatus Binatia bacterium]
MASLSSPESEPPPAADDTLTAIRGVFFEEAEDLLRAMASRLGSLSEDLGDATGLDEVAAGGHTLRGSAALAQLPTLSHVGAVLERAAELAARQAEHSRDTARSLVRETLAALNPARRMVEHARSGYAGADEVLIREMHETFSPAYQEGLRQDLEAASTAAPQIEEDVPLLADAAVETPAAVPTREPDPAAEEPAFDSALAESLAGIFQEELKDLLADVPDLLTGLVDPAEQMNLCADLGRIFHTVKGSAATVGQNQFRDLGLTLQDAFERPTEDASLLPLRPEFSSEIAEPLKDLFLTAGLEPPTAALDLLFGMAAASVVDTDDAGGPLETPPPREPTVDLEHLPAAGPDAEAAEPAAGPGAPTEPTEPIETAGELPAGASAAPPEEASLGVEPEIMEAFTLDADTALEASEGALIALEQNPADRGPLRILFRQFHTLKGAAAAVGLDRIAEQLHSGETLLENAVDAGIPGDADRFTQLLLEMLDSVTGLIDDAQGNRHDHRILPDVDARISEILTESIAQERPVPIAKPAAARIAPPSAGAAPPTTTPAPAAEGDSAIVRVHASRLDLLMNRVSELVVSRTRMDDALLSINDMRDKLNLDRLQLNETVEGFRSFEFNTVPSSGDDAETHTSNTPDEFTDLEFDKYDDFNVLTRTLVELAADTGEMLEQLSGVLDGLGEEGRQISKVSSSLQRTVSAMRLQSLDTLFRKLQRAIRDAARNAGREVEIVAIGGDVQLDRGLIESLYGPLLHVVRNAVSHGIESPEEREQAGKPSTGRITLEALQRQGSVEIIVRDDGRGLDFDAIHAKAERLGMLPPEASATRDQLSRLIFRPGFSTQEQVTDLAGRGIGMDVVASDVEQLRGTVSVNSRDGAGTTFGITLPLAAMIEQVLVLRAGEQIFALSQAPIETVLCIEPEHIEYGPNGARVRIGGSMLPALSLAAVTGQPTGHPSTALVVQDGDERIALLVDRIEAQREAVIRPLSRLFSGHPFITSATFAGDGQVVFVLDSSRLPALAQRISTPKPEAPPESRSLVAGTTPTSATVLWADDSISVRKLAGLFLNAEGWSAETAVDGMDALEKLRRGRFQVVVTDLEMPRLHGYELLQEIRADPELSNLPVVVCSSRSSEKHRRRAREAGANGYLTKPFTQEALATVVRECLAEPPAPMAAPPLPPAPERPKPPSIDAPPSSGE